MTELFISAFVTLFVVIDSPGCAPIFYSLTTGASAIQRRHMAIRAVLVAAFILLAFAFLGEALLGTLGISLEAFRIAGGIMLFFIALEMVFEQRTRRREDRARKIRETPQVEDVAIFPMAMPMIAGPGSIATVMLLAAGARGVQANLLIFAALAANLAILLAALLAIGPVMRLMGDQVEAVVTRVLGVILAALAVQFVLDGLRGSIL